MFKLTIYHKVPSLNALLSMNPWQRKKEKVATQDAFLCALRALGDDFSIPIMSPPSISSTVSVIAMFSATIQKQKLTYASRKRKSVPKKKNGRRLK